MATSKIIAHVEARMEELKARTLASLQKAGRPRVVAQTVFITAARACGLQATRNIVSDMTAVKPLVRAMVADGSLVFHHVEGGTSYYTIPSVDGMTGNTAHQAGGATFEVNPRHIEEDCLHLQAGRLIASRVWRVNTRRLEEARDKHANGYLFDDFKWVKCPTEDDTAFIAQRQQIAAISAIVESIGVNVAFDAFCDDRGRFYVRGGYASPYMGKLGRWLYTADDECTLDHRTSFAQNFSLLTGDSMGKHCGVGTAEDCDFWHGLLAPYGVNIAPHSLHRDACKAYGMPLFYGAGQSLAAQRRDALLKQAVSAGEIDQPQADAIAEALDAVGEKLKGFQELTRSFAQSFVDWGEDPYWTTPSGFRAEKRYRTHKTIVWNSGENDCTWYCPKSMTLKVKTGTICTQPKDEADKSILVATTANILQSLDAALMAKVIVSFKQETGVTLFPLHDSYTVPKELAPALTTCVIQAMRELADSEEMKALRRELNLPPVKVITGKARPSDQMRNLDLRQMNPLDEE
jgi:hypothetical protein